MMLDRNTVFENLTGFLTDTFEVEAGLINEDALLGDDLGLDSIDAIDLVIQLQELIGKKIPPEEFKTVRSVRDVLDRIEDLLKA